MGDWLKDEKGMRFKETSAELLHPTIKQRGRQETRWARADLSALQAFTRNAPTIYNCYGLEAEKYRQENNNTALKEVERKMSNLRESSFWISLIGYVQILNIVVEASLESQHSSYFSTSALFLVTKAMEKINSLGNDWHWEREDLHFAGIGSPAFLIAQLQGSEGGGGKYKPIVSLGAKKRAARKISSLRHYRTDMFNQPPDPEDTITHEMIEVGEIPIENYEIFKEMKVISELRNICESLYNNFHERLRPSALLTAATKAFHSDFEWFIEEEDVVVVEDQHAEHVLNQDAHQANHSSPVSSDRNLLQMLLDQNKSDDVNRLVFCFSCIHLFYNVFFSPAPFKCIMDNCNWRFHSKKNGEEHINSCHPNWREVTRTVNDVAASSPSPSSELQKNCKDCQEATQHHCKQCGSVRCTQRHLETRDDGDSFICYFCDPTVKGFGKQSPLQGLSLAAGQASGLGAGDGQEDGQEDAQSDDESLPSPSRLWRGDVVSRGVRGRLALVDAASPPPPSSASSSGLEAGEDQEEVRSELPPPLSQSQDTNFNKAKELIKDIHDNFPASISMDYEVDALTEGFLQFVRLKKLKGYRSLEEHYADFYSLSRNVESADQFISFFEKIQLKSFSEAICESIGSIMKISTGKNRNLEPINLSKEIYLCFNLPPLHILKKTFIPELVKKLRKNRSFFRKTVHSRQSWVNKLKFVESSATLGNFRKKEEMRSKLPLEWFQ